MGRTIKEYNNYDILKWDNQKPSTTLSFLDLTLMIENNHITTKTFQNADNPYLYIPPHSEHTRNDSWDNLQPSLDILSSKFEVLQLCAIFTPSLQVPHHTRIEQSSFKKICFCTQKSLQVQSSPYSYYN